MILLANELLSVRDILIEISRNIKHNVLVATFSNRKELIVFRLTPLLSKLQSTKSFLLLPQRNNFIQTNVTQSQHSSTLSFGN